MIKTIHSLLLLLVFVGCRGKHSEGRLFELLPERLTGVDFSNQININEDFNVLDFDYIYNGGGVAIADFNGDELPDIFFTGNMVSSRLYLNQGGFKFKDVTGAAKVETESWAEGVTVVDINGDGFLDIYISVSNRDNTFPHANLLFVNQGNNHQGIPVFVEMAASYGIDDRGYNTQAAFFDYDGDGNLDLFVLSNALESFQRNLSRPRDKSGRGKSNDKLYRNNGNGTFSNVTKDAGISIEGYGLGLAVTDINRDGWPDIYVANDFISNDVFYINNGDGTFSNRIADMLNHQSFNAMGVDVADYNNDGLSDIVVLDMFPPDNLRQKTMFAPTENYDLYQANLDLGYEPQYVRNTLQLNRGNGSFSEIGYLAGVFQTDWSWSPLFADLDNDGWRDLFISNGYGKDVTDMDYINFTQNLGPFASAEDRRKLQLEGLSKLREVRLANFVFQNQKDLTFHDKSKAWGITHSSISNGMAYADLDNDGDLDLVINNLNESAFIYKNTQRENAPSQSNYLKIKLQGPNGNSMGLGTKIVLRLENEDALQQIYYEHFPTKGYKSFVDPVAHFGLGSIQSIHQIDVIWPDGKVQNLNGVGVNSTLVLNYENSERKEPLRQEVIAPIYLEVSKSMGIAHAHMHPVYKDFNRQRLLPHKHSENGPGTAVGDVNGDSLEDFFVGGSAGNSGRFFIQKQDGTFYGVDLAQESPYDDMGCLLVDIDNDGDLDLYVVSGGARHESGSLLYKDRIYVNDGKGGFQYMPDLLPEMNFSGSVVSAADFDGDGFLDLFVGGRVVPGKYPLSPRSAILKNAGGRFIDVTDQVCKPCVEMGMVTSAIWTDFDSDGKVDLIIAGEWMPIKFIKQEKAKDGVFFTDASDKYGPKHSEGWWNSIYAIDFDKDGVMEYVLGNHGRNTRWKASPDKPLKLIAKDFDGNQSIDPILFQFLQDEFYAVPGRDALVSQIPSWKKRFLFYSDYARFNLDNFFPKGELSGATFLNANYFESSILKRGVSGKYSLTPLPIEAQFGSIFGIQEDGDNLLMIGNFYGNETISGRYDALKGIHLNASSREIKVYSLLQSGFLTNGEGRSMAFLVNKDGKRLIIAVQHGGPILVFKRNEKDPADTPAISLGPLDHKVFITEKSGLTVEREFFYGNGYLSQSSRTLPIDPHLSKVEAIDYSGKKRLLWQEN